jgi:hypothetical protein
VVPRDRDASFNPVVVPKRRNMIDVLENIIISFYAKGMSVSDIQEQIKELYDFVLDIKHNFQKQEIYTNLKQVLDWIEANKNWDFAYRKFAYENYDILKVLVSN